MLQQTRVETVIPYFERFLRELPTVAALAEAPSEQVMSLWSGLGYYRRARMLHEGARHIAVALGGEFPTTVEALVEVNGIGRYTAGAVASIAFGRRAALVDGNVARVLARLFAVEEEVRGGAGLRRIWALADALVPLRAPGDWNQALMELGATTCTPRAPRCFACPVGGECDARARGIEASLPRLRPRATAVEARQVALVATRKGGVLLARRRAGGLFGGLWEPPTVPAPAPGVDPLVAIRALLGMPVPRATRAGDVTHLLSHRRLETTVLSSRLTREPPPAPSDGSTYDALRVVPIDELGALGVSTFARKVLEQAGVRRAAAPRICYKHGSGTPEARDKLGRE